MVVLEEMVPHGGLAGMVKEVAWDAGVRCRISALTLKDEFVHLYGSHGDLLAAHGISMPALTRLLSEG